MQKEAAAPPLPPGAAQATGPLLRPQGCWRFAFRAKALRAALDAGDLGGPWEARAVRPRACPARRARRKAPARGNLITAEPTWRSCVTQNQVCTKPGMLHVDGGDDLGGGPSLVCDGQGRWDGEGVVLAACQADVGGDQVAGLGGGDVGEEQPGDALAFPLRGGGVVPDGGQVGDQLLDPGLLGVG